MKTLKCRRIPKIRFPEKDEDITELSIKDRANFELMDDERWFEWSGEPIKINLSPTTEVERIHITIKPTPIMIYAKEVYGIPYIEYKKSKLVKKARIDLGIDDKSKLIPMERRIRNFEVFEKNHFANEFDSPVHGYYLGETPKIGMEAYTEIKNYCLSSYGSLMILRVINESIMPKFIIGVSGSRNFQAGGGYKANFIKLPKVFPSQEYFKISKQKIVGTAIIHHEFEHTRYGKNINSDKDRNIMEELLATKLNENPVRILLGEEPRYVYYSERSNETINIITEEIKIGKWTFNKDNPSKLMVEIK